MVGTSNRETPNANDLMVCAENDRCVHDGRTPRWLKLQCQTPVRGKYVVIIRNKKGTVALAIAEIKLKDTRNKFINMFPRGNNI